MDTSILNQKELIQAALGAWRQAGEQRLMPITGQSMHPLLHPGDQVVITHNLAALQPGDIIVFWDTERLLVHRLLRIDAASKEARFVAKGDNQLDSDPPVTAEALVGRVQAIRRGDRLLSLETSLWRRLGWLLAVGGRGWLRLRTWTSSTSPRWRSRWLHRLTVRLHRVVQLFLMLIVGLVGRWKRL